MPTYVYKFVDTGETIEVHQAFTDDTLTQVEHPDSGVPMAVKKVFTPVGVTFKGSGFFKTDNRGKKSASSNGSADVSSRKGDAATGTSDSASSGSSGSDSAGSSDSGGSASSGSKDTSKSTSGSGSSKSTSSSTD